MRSNGRRQLFQMLEACLAEIKNLWNNWSSFCQTSNMKITHLPETEIGKVSFEKNHKKTLNKLKWIYYWWFICIWNLCGVVFQCRAIRGRRRSQLVSLGTIHLQRFTLKKALELCHSMLWTKLVFTDLKCTALKQFTFRVLVLLPACVINEHAFSYFQVKIFPLIMNFFSIYVYDYRPLKTSFTDVPGPLL